MFIQTKYLNLKNTKKYTKNSKIYKNIQKYTKNSKIYKFYKNIQKIVKFKNLKSHKE